MEVVVLKEKKMKVKVIVLLLVILQNLMLILQKKLIKPLPKALIQQKNQILVEC